MISPRTSSLRNETSQLLQKLKEHSVIGFDDAHKSSKCVAWQSKTRLCELPEKNLSTNIGDSALNRSDSDPLRKVTCLYHKREKTAQDFGSFGDSFGIMNRWNSVDIGKNSEEKCIQCSNRRFSGSKTIDNDAPHHKGTSNDFHSCPRLSQHICTSKDGPKKTEEFLNDDNKKQNSRIAVMAKSSPTLRCFQCSPEPKNLPRSEHKMSYFDQQLASSAHMHAQTHSHANSRCYCTQSSPFTHYPLRRNKQCIRQRKNIPARLKEKRLSSQKLYQQSKEVKWADDADSQKDLHFTLSQGDPRYENMNVQGSLKSESSLDKAKHLSAVSHQQMFDDVKRFRESHWIDCHAPTRGILHPLQNCTSRYIMNDRLFLEPVCSADCRTCTLPSSAADAALPPGHTRVTSLPSLEVPYNLVTLPKQLLNSNPGYDKRSTVASSKVQKKTSKQRDILRKGVHVNSVLRLAQPYNSLALRHQKTST